MQRMNTCYYWKDNSWTRLENLVIITNVENLESVLYCSYRMWTTPAFAPKRLSTFIKDRCKFYYTVKILHRAQRQNRLSRPIPVWTFRKACTTSIMYLSSLQFRNVDRIKVYKTQHNYIIIDCIVLSASFHW